MIIWKGIGFLALLVPISLAIIASFIFGEDPLFSGIGYIIGACIIWFLGRKLHNQPDYIQVDKTTGKKFRVKEDHSAFWIKMEYWSPLFILLGIAVALDEKTNGQSFDILFPIILLIIVALISLKVYTHFISSNENTELTTSNKVDQNSSFARTKSKDINSRSRPEKLTEEAKRKKAFYEELRNSNNASYNSTKNDLNKYQPKKDNNDLVL